MWVIQGPGQKDVWTKKHDIPGSAAYTWILI